MLQLHLVSSVLKGKGAQGIGECWPFVFGGGASHAGGFCRFAVPFGVLQKVPVEVNFIMCGGIVRLGARALGSDGVGECPGMRMGGHEE